MKNERRLLLENNTSDSDSGWRLPLDLWLAKIVRLEIDGRDVEFARRGIGLVPKDPGGIDEDSLVEVWYQPRGALVRFTLALSLVASMVVLFVVLTRVGNTSKRAVAAKRGAPTRVKPFKEGDQQLAELPRNKIMRVLHGHFGDVWAVASGPGGELATGDGGGVVRIWVPGFENEGTDCEVENPIMELDEFEDHVSDLKFFCGGRRLAIGVADGTVAVYEVPVGRLIWKTKLNGAVKHVAVSRDKSWIGAATGKDVLIFDAGTGRRLFSVGYGASENVAFDVSGRIYATRLLPNLKWQILVIDPDTRQIRRTLAAGREQVYALAVSKFSDIAAAGYNGNVRLWKSGDGDAPCILDTARNANRDDKMAWSVGFSNDGNYLAAGCADGLVRVWNVVKKVPVDKLRGHEDWVRAVAFGNGPVVVSGGSDGKVIVARVVK